MREFVESMPENKTPAVEIRMSSAGDCARKLEYDYAVGPGPISLESYLRMEIGTMVHATLTSLFAVAYGDSFHSVDRNLTLTTPKGLIVPGHPDGVLELDDKKILIEFKSCSDATFQKISNENKPLDAHLEQATCYALAMDLKWCSVIYMNRESVEFRPFVFETVNEIAHAVLDKFDRVHENSKTKTIGSRPYSDMSDSPCWYCHHKAECYKDFKAEISGNPKKILDDTFLWAMARDADAARTTRLQSDKIEQELRAKLGDILNRSHQVSEAVLKGSPSYGVKLAVGKNNNLLTTIKEEKV
jgi:hypothetical protein